jgi:hypothetical protein
VSFSNTFSYIDDVLSINNNFPNYAVSSLISSKDRGLVKHLQETAIYLCKDYCTILESNKARVIQTDLIFRNVESIENKRMVLKNFILYRISSRIGGISGFSGVCVSSFIFLTCNSLLCFQIDYSLVTWTFNYNSYHVPRVPYAMIWEMNIIQTFIQLSQIPKANSIKHRYRSTLKLPNRD